MEAGAFHVCLSTSGVVWPGECTTRRFLESWGTDLCRNRRGWPGPGAQEPLAPSGRGGLLGSCGCSPLPSCLRRASHARLGLAPPQGCQHRVFEV